MAADTGGSGLEASTLWRLAVARSDASLAQSELRGVRTELEEAAAASEAEESCSTALEHGLRGEVMAMRAALEQAEGVATATVALSALQVRQAEHDRDVALSEARTFRGEAQALRRQGEKNERVAVALEAQAARGRVAAARAEALRHEEAALLAAARQRGQGAMCAELAQELREGAAAWRAQLAGQEEASRDLVASMGRAEARAEACATEVQMLRQELSLASRRREGESSGSAGPDAGAGGRASARDGRRRATSAAKAEGNQGRATTADELLVARLVEADLRAQLAEARRRLASADVEGLERRLRNAEEELRRPGVLRLGPSEGRLLRESLGRQEEVAEGRVAEVREELRSCRAELAQARKRQRGQACFFPF